MNPTSVHIVVLGVPVAKGRPRFRTVKTAVGSEFVRTYSPKETVRYEDQIGLEARIAMFNRPKIEGPISMCVTAFFEPPASWPKWKKRDALAGLILPTSKPDCDNLAKVCDALNGVVFKDDAAIVDLTVRKRFRYAPGLVIEVSAYVPVPLVQPVQPELCEVEA